jgi:hypothetical protein
MSFEITDPSARAAINAAIAAAQAAVAADPLTGNYSQAYQAVVDALTETIVDPETGTVRSYRRESIDPSVRARHHAAPADAI